MKKTYIFACLLMITGLSIQTMAQTDPGTANLTHQWTFDNGTADDMVGTVNGVLSDGAIVADGVLNTIDGGIVTLDAAALAINTYTELTVEAWFTPAAGLNNGYHFLYYFGNSDGNGREFTGYTPSRGGDDSSKAMLGTGDGESGVSGAEYNDSVKHHMVCVIDATTLTYYIDGILTKVGQINGNSLANVGTDFAWFCKGGWADPSWRGTIDEISIYNTALTYDNVKYLHSLKADAIVAENPGTTNLTHQWTFDDGTANDGVGTANGILEDGAVITDKALNTAGGGFVSLDASALAINTYSELTVESWFEDNTGVNGGFRFLYYFGNSDGNGNHFTGYTPVRGTGLSRVMIDTGSGDHGINATRYDDSRLHHAVMVIDATDVHYYMDGILLNSTPLGDVTLAAVGNQFAWFCKGGWPDPTWQGLTHKISIYNSALSAANVKYLYDLGAETIGTGGVKTETLNNNVFVSKNQIVAEFESANSSQAQIAVYNLQGALLSSEIFSINAGLNHKTIAADYPSGIYLVRLSVAGQTSFTKIVK